MPSREEIVEWLREAAGYAELVALRDGGRKNNTPLSQHYTRKQEEFEKRSKQVENMHCETCSKRESDVGVCGDLEVFVLSKFGCFSWEAKEDGNNG